MSDQSKRIQELEQELAAARKVARTKRAPMLSVGGAIQRLREERGMGLRDLAEKSGISPGTLCRIEQSKNPNPTWEVLRGIALVMDVTVGQIESEFAKMTYAARQKADKPAPHSEE